MKTGYTLFTRLLSTAVFSVLFFALPAQAAQFIAYGDYEIHYNAFNSSFVEPDVAKTYGLQRGKRRAMVNISVLQKEEDGTKKPISALISGSAANLLQQTQNLDFKKIDEGNAVYYIGQFGFSDDMLMRISVSVQPDPNKPSYDLQFEQRFYAD